jgi:hypothetical protein
MHVCTHVHSLVQAEISFRLPWRLLAFIVRWALFSINVKVFQYFLLPKCFLLLENLNKVNTRSLMHTGSIKSCFYAGQNFERKIMFTQFLQLLFLLFFCFQILKKSVLSGEEKKSFENSFVKKEELLLTLATSVSRHFPKNWLSICSWKKPFLHR